MVSQYPHSLYLKTSFNSDQDVNGNWITIPETFNLLSVCRYEPNKNGLSDLQDGRASIPSGIIYFPVTDTFITPDSKIRVTDESDNILCEGTVKLFSRGSFNCRIWL